MKTLKDSIKSIFLSMGYMAVIVIFCIIPLALAFAINTVITGNFDFAIKYLDMVCFGVGALMVVLLFKKNGKPYLPKSVKVSGKFLLSVMIIGAFITVINDTIYIYATFDPNDVIKVNFVKQFAAIFQAPFVEELIMRYLATAAIKKDKKDFSIVALLFTSIVFTALHFSSNPVVWINHMVFALFLGFVYQTTGSYKACVLGHMGSNIANTLIMVIYNYTPKSVFLVLCIASIIVMIAVVTLFITEFRKMDKLCNPSKIWYNRPRFAKQIEAPSEAKDACAN